MSGPLDGLPPDQLAVVEKALAELAFTIPTEPGFYRDQQGDLWRLDADGHWYDMDGETRPLSWNYVLVIFAPFTLVPAPTQDVSES